VDRVHLTLESLIHQPSNTALEEEIRVASPSYQSATSKQWFPSRRRHTQTRCELRPFEHCVDADAVAEHFRDHTIFLNSSSLVRIHIAVRMKQHKVTGDENRSCKNESLNISELKEQLQNRRAPGTHILLLQHQTGNPTQRNHPIHLIISCRSIQARSVLEEPEATSAPGAVLLLLLYAAGL